MINKILLILIITPIFSFAQTETIDSTFGKNGAAINDIFYRDVTYSLAIQPDGKIIAGGDNDSDLIVLRYKANGTLDSTFGTNGVTAIDFDSNYDNSGNVLLQPDGKIIVRGASDAVSVCMARLKSNGILDSSFGINGKVKTYNIQNYFYGPFDGAAPATLLSNGKILVAFAFTQTDGYNHLMLIRYLPDGIIDSTFGTNGIAISKYNLGSYNYTSCDVITINNGKILAGGRAGSYRKLDMFVSRFLENGTDDSTFGEDGITKAGLHSFSSDCSSILIQNRKIVATGFHEIDTVSSIDLLTAVRFNANGVIDSSFGINGIQTLTTAYSAIGTCGQLQSDNKILIGGTAFINSADFCLARLNADGTIDNSFSAGGIITSDFEKFETARAMAIQADGKIILGGYQGNNGPLDSLDFMLVRYGLTSVLPLKIIAFTATKQQFSTLLQWQTTNEINNSYFNIERSADLKTFTAIGNKPGLNNAYTNNYLFTDNAPLKGINYYRLKQFDKDGKFSYSGIASAEFLNEGLFAITPNPATNNITIVIPSSDALSEIIIYDIAGKKILHETFAGNITSKQINISSLASGVYNVVLLQDGKKEVMKIVKK